MTTTTFDSLGYFEKLKAAGVPEEQAKVQAEAMRQQAEEQRSALQKALEKYDETSRRELATKGDVQDVRLEIEKVRAEVEKVRAEVEKNKYDLLKWQIAGWVALAAIMAKGFGWLGF